MILAQGIGWATGTLDQDAWHAGGMSCCDIDLGVADVDGLTRRQA